VVVEVYDTLSIFAEDGHEGCEGQGIVLLYIVYVYCYGGEDYGLGEGVGGDVAGAVDCECRFVGGVFVIASDAAALAV